MTNPFAHLQQDDSNKSFQVLSVSNIASISRIVSVTGILCPDFSRYAVSYSPYDSHEYGYDIFDTLSNKHIKQIKPVSYTRHKLQFNRDGSKAFFNKTIYDVNSEATQMTSVGTGEYDLFLSDWDFKYYYYNKSRLFKKSVLACVNMLNMNIEWSDMETYISTNSIISPDGSLIVVYKLAGDDVVVYNTVDRKIVCKLDIPRANIKFSLDGKSLFIDERKPTDFFFGSNTNTANNTSIWSASDGKCVYKDSESYQMIANIDSTLLFLVRKDGVISIYDVNQWKVLKEIRLDYESLKDADTPLSQVYADTALDISSDGTKLLIKHWGGQEIWGVR